MGIGDGGRGNPRGRPQGRPVYPNIHMGENDDQTPLQELAQEVESSSTNRARSQPPTRRSDATHPMTTRQQTAPSTTTTPSLLESVVNKVSSVLTGTPSAPQNRPPSDQPPPPSSGQPTRPTLQLVARDSTVSHDPQTEPDPDATTLYGDNSPSQQASLTDSPSVDPNQGGNLVDTLTQVPEDDYAMNLATAIVQQEELLAQAARRQWVIDPQEQARYNMQQQAEQERIQQQMHPGVPPAPQTTGDFIHGVSPIHGSNIHQDQTSQQGQDGHERPPVTSSTSLPEMRHESAQDEVLNLLDQTRSHTAPGALPGQTAQQQVPVSQSMAGAAFQPASHGQHVSWGHAYQQMPGHVIHQNQLGRMPSGSQRQTPPGMMQGPAPRFGPPQVPQRRSSHIVGHADPDWVGNFSGQQQPVTPPLFRPRQEHAESPHHTYYHPLPHGPAVTEH